MDNMVNARLIYTLELNNLIDSNQFGFRKCKQTIDSLMDLNINVQQQLNGKNHVQLISFDIRKAFDRIWPNSVLDKFQSFGIGGRMFSYVKSYLSPRLFTVINGNVESDETKVDIGVPQGSPLSSTLFIISFQHIMDPL